MNKKISLKQIEEFIEPIDYDFEVHVGKISEKKAKYWAKSNASRHAYIFKYIIDYISKNKMTNLKIINSSGISHQDICMCHFLKKILKIKYTYIVYESPTSSIINNEYLQKLIIEFNIKLNLVNFDKSTNVFKDQSAGNIVLFSEIVEHLDHSTFLNCLINIKEIILPGGVLILTTPNLVSFINRIRILFGNGDGPYWGDGLDNYKKGLYGHITLYDIKRLTRILEDCGYSINYKNSFTSKIIICKKYLFKFLIYKVADLLSFLGMKNLGETIFMAANKSNNRKKIRYST